ncbi:MAG: hypothetical protein RSC68_35335, partial [Acinetobacter sp.]
MSPSQWRMIDTLCAVLRPFNEATLLVSRADACLSATLPLIKLIDKTLAAMFQPTHGPPGQGIQQEDHCIRERIKLAHTVLKNLRRHQRILSLKEDEDCLLATFMDPRFKSTMSHFMPGFSHTEALGKCRGLLEARVQAYLTQEHRQLEGTASRSSQQPRVGGGDVEQASL